MTSRNSSPLSLSAIIGGLIVAILGGVIVAALVKEGRFADPTPTPADLDTPSKPQPASALKSRAEMLVLYNSIYDQQGWCDLWSRLIEDSLVKGTCPSLILQWAREDVDTSTGKVNLITGLQMRADGDLEVHYPGCVTFGQANYTGGTIKPWIHNDFIATNITMYADSVLSLFFRCDNAWTP